MYCEVVSVSFAYRSKKTNTDWYKVWVKFEDGFIGSVDRSADTVPSVGDVLAVKVVNSAPDKFGNTHLAVRLVARNE